MATRNLLNFCLSLISHVSVAVAIASSPTQSLTIGSPSHPPFGLPPSDFALAIAHPVSNASFPTTGYNTSIPAGPVDATGNEIPGWYLSISVAANIPLTNASSISAKDKHSKFIEAAVLSLVPPSTHQGALDAESWRVCAIVFIGGLSAETTETAQTARLDGTCAALLPSECIQGLQINSVANNTGKDKEDLGACGSLAVPDACLEYFGGTTIGVGYEIDNSNFDQSNRRYSFFVGASAPAGKDNASALVAMERVVWPVVITWTHFSSSGEVHDSAGWLSCVKAPNTTNWIAAKNAGMGKGKSMWALIVALVLTGVVTAI